MKKVCKTLAYLKTIVLLCDIQILKRNIMKKQITVIAPEGCEKYLTPGKEYKIFKECFLGFYIIDDAGCELSCLWKRCSHLNGGDWIIKSDPSTVTYDIPVNVQRMNIDFENRTVEFVPSAVSTPWVPTDGDVVYCENEAGWKGIMILKERKNSLYYYYFSVDAAIAWTNENNYSVINFARPATPVESERLFSALAERGLKWNADEKRIEKVRWRAAEGEKYWYIDFGNIYNVEDNYDKVDDFAYKNGAYFRTEAEAQSAFEQVKELLTKIHDEISNVKTESK